MSQPRHRAREAALQVLYLCEVGRVSVEDALRLYFETHGEGLPEPARQFTARLVTGTTADQDALDALIREHTHHWRLERLSVIDRLILRLAAWELRHESDVPAAVVLDEAIELARTFGSDESARFVNGVLDAIHRTSGPDGDEPKG